MVPTSRKFKHALGAILGVCVGDACGGPLEFRFRSQSHLPDEATIQQALNMCGGGVHHLQSGQITDDGELTICLLQALALGGETLRDDFIAEAYIDWIASDPVDKGMTVGGAINHAQRGHNFHTDGLNRAYTMRKWAQTNSSQSKSNGSMMRVSPLGVWAHDLSPEQIAMAARIDATLTHSNEAAVVASECYAILIASLIKTRGNRSIAFETSKSWAQSHNSEVLNWHVEAEEHVLIQATHQEGFVRIAFVIALQSLLRGDSYEQAITSTLALGGDTDSNAAIVGGIIGAACGYESIPAYMLNPVTNCVSRPAWLQPKHLVPLVAAALIRKRVVPTTASSRVRASLTGDGVGSDVRVVEL